MKDIKAITEQLEQGVKEVFTSDKYIEYLRFMSKFTSYSFNNTLLIFMQKPDASLVAGYKSWQQKGRQVRKGEKGITILAPCPHKKEIETEDGEKQTISWTSFRAVSVFDVSQTDGDELPTGCVTKLTGSVEGYAELIAKLESVSPVSVSYENIKGTANGYYSHSEQRIVIQEGMSEAQTVKTLVHEISHAILHSEEGEEKDADRRTREVQAESVAYTVCNMLGLDSSDYSFGYVAGWSSTREIKELNESMEVIRKTAKDISDKLAA